MRDKVFICGIAAVFLILFIWCPALFLLDKTEIITVEDLANYKDPEKVYYYNEQEKIIETANYNAVPENIQSQSQSKSRKIPFFANLYITLFNGIEQGKATVDTVYTNYLPFYSNILNFVNSNETKIQSEFVLMLYNFENPIKNTIPQNINFVESENDANDEESSSDTESTTESKTEPESPETPQFIASKVRDAGMFRVYIVRSPDNSIGFLDISMAMPHETAAANMLDEQRHINRIAASNTDVNFFVYIATRMQDTKYYNTIIPSSNELSTNDILQDFVVGVKGVAGISWSDIDTFEKRMELRFKTDHHWNAMGVYRGYCEIMEMMSKTLPNIGAPLPLKGLIEFPNVEYRGSGAARTQTPIYYDTFEVMDIDLPAQHPSERVRSKLEQYQNGTYDAGKVGRNDYTSHYENFYNRPEIITYPKNNTGRKLLILGDSYVYWISWLIGAHFDQTFIHYTLDEKNLNYNKFIADNGITDVLLLQYSARTLSKATSATKYLEQVITD